MFKISESLIQFEELALVKTEETMVQSADRILRTYRSALEEKNPRGLPTGAPSPDKL